MAQVSRGISWCCAALAAAVGLAASGAAAVPVKVGAMGDSYSDEYSVLGGGLYNWVDLLVVSGRADFGAFGNFPSGDPRNTGGAGSYTYNFSKGGATTTSALGSTTFLPTVNNNRSQPGSPNRPDLWPGIRGAGTSGAIEYASQELGGNDMLDLIINQQKLLLGVDTGSMNPILSRVEQIANIATAGYTSPLKMVMVQYPDLGSMPVFAGLPQFGKDSIRANVQYFNGAVDGFAALHGMGTVDLFSLWDDLRNGGGTDIHGIHISPGTSSGGLTDLRSAWLSDGLHPTPIFQAMWANEFISVLNNHYGESIPLLSPKEMVTLTGVDPQQNPIAVAGSDYTVAVGDVLSLSALGSTDPNPGDIPYLSYSWDINGDGIFGDAFGLSPTLDWSQLVALGITPGSVFDVRVRVDDSFGGVTDSLVVPLTVVPEPATWLLGLCGGAACLLAGFRAKHAQRGSTASRFVGEYGGSLRGGRRRGAAEMRSQAAPLRDRVPMCAVGREVNSRSAAATLKQSTLSTTIRLANRRARHA